MSVALLCCVAKDVHCDSGVNCMCDRNGTIMQS